MGPSFIPQAQWMVVTRWSQSWSLLWLYFLLIKLGCPNMILLQFHLCYKGVSQLLLPYQTVQNLSSAQLLLTLQNVWIKLHLIWTLGIFFTQLITFLHIGIIACFAFPRARAFKSVLGRLERQGDKLGMVSLILYVLNNHATSAELKLGNEDPEATSLIICPPNTAIWHHNKARFCKDIQPQMVKLKLSYI